MTYLLLIQDVRFVICVCLVNINPLNRDCSRSWSLLAFLMQSKDEQQAPFPRLYHQLSRKGLPFQLLFVLLWYMVLVSKNSDLVCSVNRVIDWNVFYPALPFAFNSTFNTLAAVKPCKTMRWCFCSMVFTKILGTAQSFSSEAYWKRNKDACCISSTAVPL